MVRLQAEYKKKIKHWIDNQHMAMWQGLNSTQKHTLKLISGPSPTANTIQATVL